MPSTDSRLNLLSWVSQSLLWAVLLPFLFDYKYPFYRYVLPGLVVAVGSINFYLMAEYNRRRRENSRKEREEYRRLNQQRDY